MVSKKYLGKSRTKVKNIIQSGVGSIRGKSSSVLEPKSGGKTIKK